MSSDAVRSVLNHVWNVIEPLGLRVLLWVAWPWQYGLILISILAFETLLLSMPLVVSR
jgi:hypothetical protein